jgi:hypothetical protein
MIDHRYTLEQYKGMNTRYGCPDCQRKDKTFSRYIDTETGESLHPTVGRCNRESKCGYHYSPKAYFQDNNISFDKPIIKRKPQAPKPISFVPDQILKASLKGYESNHFVTYLINLFGIEISERLISQYFIASSNKRWSGATVFWQIDAKNKIRTGKIMPYSPTTGKRVKQPNDLVDWVHKALKLPEFELKQCLFGEHLLSDNTKPVALVESEKSAVIASVYLPEFTWLAVGGLSHLNAEKCAVLKGRTVTLFPDLNGFDKWSEKAQELSHLATFIVSDLLERKATEEEKSNGLDLADYLIRFDYKDFIIPVLPSNKQLSGDKLLVDNNQIKPIETSTIFNVSQQQPVNWERDITELETYFTGVALPTQPVKLNQCTTITDVSKRELALDLDKTSDISRACFLCHDPDVWRKGKRTREQQTLYDMTIKNPALDQLIKSLDLVVYDSWISKDLGECPY